MQPRRVLVADSHDDCRETFAELLRIEGHQVATASSFAAALAALRRQVADVAIVDSRLRGAAARDFETLARASPAALVVLTTTEVPELASQFAVLRKPCTFLEVRHLSHRWTSLGFLAAAGADRLGSPGATTVAGEARLLLAGSGHQTRPATRGSPSDLPRS